MAGYDGLALSLYDKNAQTFTDDGAHNFFSITLTDSTTVTSGYIQPFYASITQTGGESAGAQINAFAADIFLGGAHAGEVSGAYIYVAESGTFTSAGILSGYTVYFGSMASATPPAYRAGFHAYSEEADGYGGSGADAGLLVECSGASGTWGAAIGVMGSTPPEFFLHCPSNVPWSATTRMIRVLGTDNSTVAAQLRVKVYSTEYFIPLYATTCS
jgi:hypothetical protein